MLSRIIAALLLFHATACLAEEPAYDPSDGGRLTFVFGPYVYHYHYDAKHTNTPWLTGFEWEPSESWLGLEYGAVYFRNSFAQPSVYAYAGKRWFAESGQEGPYLKITAGPLYGYRGQYENKVPFNHDGLAVAVIPGLGYQFHKLDVQFVILGSAALLLTFGYDLPK
jgi:hypothetical protein